MSSESETKPLGKSKITGKRTLMCVKGLVLRHCIVGICYCFYFRKNTKRLLSMFCAVHFQTEAEHGWILNGKPA